MGKFKNDLQTGKKGEKVVIDFLRDLEGITDVLDVSGINTFQKLDIDLVCVQESGEYIPVEVKTDTMTHKTGNVVYEVYSNKRYGTQGCFEKTKAKYIFYYLEKVDHLYIFITDKLRNYVKEEYVGKHRLFDMGDNAQGYLIPLEELKEAKIAIRVI